MVLVLDLAAEAEVVAQDQHGLDAARRRDVTHHRRRQFHLLARLPAQQSRGLVHDGELPPEPLHRELRGGCERTPHPHCEIETRGFQRAVVRVDVIVEQVDAADEHHLPVDHRELPVQAPQAPPVEREAARLGPVGFQRHAAGGQHPRHFPAEPRRAEAVDDHPHLDAAPRGGGERGGDRARTRVVGEDVGLERDVRARRVDRFDQRREELASALEQHHLVPALPHRPEAVVPGAGSEVASAHGCRERSATRGLWSESCAHSGPRSTCAALIRKPRV
jgi:hypothetical protein